MSPQGREGRLTPYTSPAAAIIDDLLAGCACTPQDMLSALLQHLATPTLGCCTTQVPNLFACVKALARNANALLVQCCLHVNISLERALPIGNCSRGAIKHKASAMAGVTPVVSCETRNGSSHSGTQLHRSQAPGNGSDQSSHPAVPVPTLSLTDARRRRVSTARKSACKRDAEAVRSAHRKHLTTHAHAAQPWLQTSVTLEPSFTSGTSQSSRCNAVEQSALFLQLRPIPVACSSLRALSPLRSPLLFLPYRAAHQELVLTCLGKV